MQRRPAALDAVAVIDISLSMAKPHGDLLPSKLEAAKEAVAHAAYRLLDGKTSRLGVVVFHDRAFPLVPLTVDYKRFISGLSKLTFTGEGSAAGDGIVEAVKMLRRSPRPRLVAVFTDAGFNAGIPLEAAAAYAANMQVTLTIVTVGKQPSGDEKSLLDRLARYGSQRIHASTRTELLAAARRALGVEEVATA